MHQATKWARYFLFPHTTGQALASRIGLVVGNRRLVANLAPDPNPTHALVLVDNGLLNPRAEIDARFVAP